MQRIEKYDVYPIPCKDIYCDSAFNCRGQFMYEEAKELAESIAKDGLMFPIVVQPAEDVVGDMPPGYPWRMLAGHRRWTAIHIHLKLPEIPGMIRRGLTDRESRILNFTENLERKDLNPLQEALAIQLLFPDCASGQPAVRAIAAELNRDLRWTFARLRILKLPEEVQQMVAAGRVTLLDMEMIFREPTDEQRITLARALAASKRGPAKQAYFEDGTKVLRRFRRRRNKAEINDKITKLFELGLQGLPTRIAAWCAGGVSDEEIDQEILAEYEIQKRLSGVDSVAHDTTDHQND